MCNNIIIAIIVVILVVWLIYPYFEGFDSAEYALSPLSQPQYGLRGDRLRTDSIDKYYISPDRQIRLSQSNGEMWESDNTPEMDGIGGCYKVRCPPVGYDGQDTCWKCRTKEYRMKIPDIWPHVAN